MTRHRRRGFPLRYHEDFDELDAEAYDDLPSARDLADLDRSRFRTRQRSNGEPRRARTRLTRPPRTEEDQAFKCGNCRQFIGAPISGGRQRNHCPNCLYSRHVDDTRPGDRRSDCHALMKPVGIITRRNGEEAILHRCLGCGKEAPNRIAADDNPSELMKLPQIVPSTVELVPDAIGPVDGQSA